MKKAIVFVCMVIAVLLLPITVFAGSVPEDLLYEDGAKIFFAEVVHCNLDAEHPEIEFAPVKRIKGDVEIGTKQMAYRPNIVGNFNIREGEIYLFTYFDESNPTDIFATTTQDTATLKLKNTNGDMWERFEEYLNDGKYEEAEMRRLGRAEDFIKIKNAKVLSDLLVFDRAEVKQIEIVYPGDGDPYGCLVDPEKFFDIAENIFLTKENKIDELKNGVWMIAVDNDNNRYSVWLDQQARIGCPQYETSSAVTTQYAISRADYMKLYAFLPEEATAHMPLQNPAMPYLFATIGAVGLVFSSAFSVGFIIKKKRR